MSNSELPQHSNKTNMPTEGKPIDVLEIGFGSRPAVREGELFQNPKVNYIGLELPLSFEGTFMWPNNVNDFPNITGSMNMMPFRDDAFDYVLMRSVYGQFDSQPSIVEAVRTGIYECIRVLKPNGRIVISEENTPQGMDYIESELKGAGFVIEAAHYMSNHTWPETPTDDEYLTARRPFYTERPQGAYGSLFGTPNIVIGLKPEDIVLETRTIPVMTNFYKKRNTRNDWNIRELPFRVPVRKSKHKH